MKGMSFIGFLAPIITLLLVVVWIGVAIVVKNINAKDLVFSYTALAAALVMFVLNVAFSLKNEEEEQVVQPHLTLSSEALDVYSELTSKSDFVVFNRSGLSEALGLNGIAKGMGIPELSDDQISQIKGNISEYLRVAVIGELLSEYPDWNPKTISFRGRHTTHFNNSKEGVEGNSFYSIEDLERVFEIGEKDFSLENRVGISNGLTLPPDTRLDTTGTNIIIENPFAKISITFEVEDGMSFAKPSYRNGRLFLDQRDMNCGVINIQSNIRISILRKKQRFGNSQYALYEKWVSSIVNVIEKGFSPILPASA